MDFIIEVMAAFGGGVFASIIGGTNAFIFTGVTGLIGLALSISTQNSLALDTIASGPLFGPHVAFNSGVVALAIVKRRQIAKNNDINGTNTFLSLYKFKDTLATLAAGLTGITGYLLNLFLSRNLQLQLD